MKTKGSRFLKVCGILMTICGILSVLLSILVIIAAIAIIATGRGSTIFGISVVLTLIGSIVQVVCGFLGLINCEKPEKAKKLLVWGLVCAGINVLSYLLSLVAGYTTSLTSILSLLLVLIIPFLYIIGAKKNLDEYKNQSTITPVEE